jgi:MoaA/NifB/PqqE/SkfB family radical SAM enzyme
MQEVRIPLKNIIKFGQRTMLEDDVFNVSWILGRFCNYKCSYCWPYANSSTLDFSEIYTYKSVVDRIHAQSSANGFSKIHWSLSGGEPTTYKHLIELVSHIAEYEEEQTIHMTSNISPGIKWWDKWERDTRKFARRSITASFHAEFAKENKFIEKCLHLNKLGIRLVVNQVMVPELFGETYARLAKMYELGINVTMKPQSDETASSIVYGYTEEMLSLMQQGFPQKYDGREISQIVMHDVGGETYYMDQAERFNAFGFNEFSGWKCNAGYQGLIIRGDTIKRGYSCNDEPIGNLQEFKLFSSPVKCSTPRCVSSADSKIPKFK